MKLTKSKLKQVIREEITRGHKRDDTLGEYSLPAPKKYTLPEWGKRLMAIGELAKNFFPNVKMENRTEFKNHDSKARIEWLRQLADFLEEEAFSDASGMSDTGTDEEFHE